MQQLLSRGDGANTAPPLQTWSPEEHQAAQTVVRQFDLVALLIEGRLFDPNLFLRSWQHDIVLRWQACEAQVLAQRVHFQNPSYGRHFEELVRLGLRDAARRCASSLGIRQFPPAACRYHRNRAATSSGLWSDPHELL